jgi:5'-nucleotidase
VSGSVTRLTQSSCRGAIVGRGHRPRPHAGEEAADARGLLDMTGDPELGYFVQPYVIREIGAVRIGIFGLLTELTNQISNPSPAVVLPPLSVAQAWVDSLRIGHDCDVVILLSHMGIFEEQLAAATISGIDIILGGHTHTLTLVPIEIGNTIIVQAGEFASHVGKLTVITDGGVIQSHSYQMLDVDASVPAEPTLAAMIDALAMGIEADPRFGPVYTSVLAEASTDLTKPLPEGLCKDNPLGNLVADAIRAATGAQVAIQPQGFISQTIYAGPIKGADIFQAVPYGFDTETGLGLKLVTFETNGMSLIAGLEFAVYNLPYVEDFFSHGSNLSYVYNSANPPGSRVDYSAIQVNGIPIDPYGTISVVVPDAVVPFLSQIPGFQVNNLTPTELSLYTVVRDYIAVNSPIAYYSEGRIFDLALLADPVVGVGAISDVVGLFYENGTITAQHVAISLQQHLDRIRYSLENGRPRLARVQLATLKIRIEVLAQVGFITPTSSERLVFLVDKISESLGESYAFESWENTEGLLPDDFALEQNYPNPFNGVTTIAYMLPDDSDVSLEIYDIMGRKVRTLVSEFQRANLYSVAWDGRDDAGRDASTGIYFYSLKAGDRSETRKMAYIK